MNNPLYANTVRYFLQFENVSNDWYEIFEPIYSDANTLNIEQQANSCARDIRYKDGKLRFINAYHVELAQTQIINPQGETSNHLSHLLGWWFYVLQKYGFGAKVNYKENINGIDTDVYGFDLKGDKLTDWKTFVEAELIDTGKVAKVKRTLETTFNAFSDKDWAGNTITPMSSFNYLLRAIPFNVKSNWLMKNDSYFASLSFSEFNPLVLGNDSEVKNSLMPLSPMYDGLIDVFTSFTYVKFKHTMTNIVLELNFDYVCFNTDEEMTFFVLIGTDENNLRYQDFSFLNITNNVSHNFNKTLNIPVAYANERLSVYFKRRHTSVLVKKTSYMKLSGVQTAPDFVIKASRYIDLIKQSSLFNQNIPVSASQYDVGGVHYDNAVFTKRMIGRKIDTFNTTPKKVFDSVIETNSHTEMYNDEIYINHQTEFYKNVEIGVLLAHPEKDYNVSFNPKSTVNVFDTGFGQFEQDRTTTGSNESIHTRMELRILEEQSEDKFSRTFEFSRDGIMRQKAVDLEVNNPTASTQDDDIVFAEAMIALPPNSFGVVNGVYFVRTFGYIVEVFNFETTGEINDNSFTWDMLGIGNTGELSIFGGVTNVTITEITPSKITMTSSLFLQVLALDTRISLKYYYTGVAYQTKTNEGFTLVSGVTEKMSNLDYTLGRITRNYFGEQLANYAMYCEKDITCGYFKGIPDSRTVLTQKTGESAPISENGTILFNILPQPLVTGYVHKIKAVATYEQIVNIRSNYRIERGFVRYWDAEDQKIQFGFINFNSYNEITGELLGTLEEKYTPPTLKITGTLGNLLVNDVPYNLSGIMNWWIMRNGFLTLYDENSIPISKEYEFNLVTLNGVEYATYNELSDALSLLT